MICNRINGFVIAVFIRLRNRKASYRTIEERVEIRVEIAGISYQENGINQSITISKRQVDTASTV